MLTIKYICSFLSLLVSSSNSLHCFGALVNETGDLKCEGGQLAKKRGCWRHVIRPNYVSRLYYHSRFAMGGR